MRYNFCKIERRNTWLSVKNKMNGEAEQHLMVYQKHVGKFVYDIELTEQTFLTVTEALNSNF